MNIQELYRITSHKNIVDVDDVSTSINKVSNQVLILENQSPCEKIIKERFENTTLGTILIVDAFDKETVEAFDSIREDENGLMVINTFELDGEKAILCLPENFITFYLGQELTHQKKIFKAHIITLSDRAHRGIYQDKSGPMCAELVNQFLKSVNKQLEIKLIIIPDSPEELELRVEEAVHDNIDLLITTGGTGISKRDITVQTIKPMLQKEIPGIMEMIRLKYGAEKPNALLSSGVAGTIDKTLVYTLPGSTKAVSEYLSEIFKTLDHLFYMIHGIDNH